MWAELFGACGVGWAAEQGVDMQRVEQHAGEQVGGGQWFLAEAGGWQVALGDLTRQVACQALSRQLGAVVEEQLAELRVAAALEGEATEQADQFRREGQRQHRHAEVFQRFLDAACLVGFVVHHRPHRLRFLLHHGQKQAVLVAEITIQRCQ